MEGLQILHVKFDVLPVAWQCINKEIGTQLLLPIKKVVEPREFVLSLPFPAIDSSPPQRTFPWSAVDGWEGSDPWDDLQCIIKRVSDRTEL